MEWDKSALESAPRSSTRFGIGENYGVDTAKFGVVFKWDVPVNRHKEMKTLNFYQNS